MVETERKLGLFGLIKEQQRENRGAVRLQEDSWIIYGDKKHKKNAVLGYKPYLSGYENTFGKVLSTPVVDFISKKRRPVVINIMSPSDVIAQLFIKKGGYR